MLPFTGAHDGGALNDIIGLFLNEAHAPFQFRLFGLFPGLLLWRCLSGRFRRCLKGTPPVSIMRELVGSSSI
jgi:hypothetical protein